MELFNPEEVSVFPMTLILEMTAERQQFGLKRE